MWIDKSVILHNIYRRENGLILGVSFLWQSSEFGEMFYLLKYVRWRVRSFFSEQMENSQCRNLSHIDSDLRWSSILWETLLFLCPLPFLISFLFPILLYHLFISLLLGFTWMSWDCSPSFYEVDVKFKQEIECLTTMALVYMEQYSVPCFQKIIQWAIDNSSHLVSDILHII